MKEPAPTNIYLQLTDRSITHPRGIIKDVLVKIDKFIFPIDFIVLDMEEDFDVPLILERSFLATGRALINIQLGNLILKINDEQICFNVLKTKHTFKPENCLKIDAIDQLVDKNV